MKWIILAGGLGTRLHPITLAISKQLMPIYDKPMIYYPLSVLMLAGIREILIITTPEDQSSFQRLLWDGAQWGVTISYVVQMRPDGLAQAFIIGENFIGDDDVCLILWDNIFYGQGLSHILKNSIHTVENDRKSVIFGYAVTDPSRYWVVEFDAQNTLLSIEEKPQIPKSSFAVTGIYFYTNDVIKVAKQVEPSARWQIEITSVNQYYLQEKKLHVEFLNRGFAWFDTGTHDSMLEASNFIQIIEKRQGFKIGCPEEIAYLNNWISRDDIQSIAQKFLHNDYGKYLLKIIT